MTEFNRFQLIKRRFFAMRNGVIADVIRKSGAPYPLVFGLNLPQIKEIASELPRETELADQLWADRRTRESLMLAPMVHPLEEMTHEKLKDGLKNRHRRKLRIHCATAFCVAQVSLSKPRWSSPAPTAILPVMARSDLCSIF